jgi:deoxycytidylate deaminase
MNDENNKYIRPSWDEYFMEIANTVSKRATCDRGRSGCVYSERQTDISKWLCRFPYRHATLR